MEVTSPADIPGADGVEVLQRRDEGDSRQENGTGAGADEAELGLENEEELNELEDDAEGG